MPKIFVSVSHAAELLGMSRRQFHRTFIETHDPRLKPLRFRPSDSWIKSERGRALIFLREDVERLKKNS